jgi:hypothetical protein
MLHAAECPAALANCELGGTIFVGAVDDRRTHRIRRPAGFDW